MRTRLGAGLAARCASALRRVALARGGRTAVAAAVLLAGLAPAADACPYCSLSQGADTLVYIAAFVLLPYVIVTGVWVWLKRLLASENEGSA